MQIPAQTPSSIDANVGRSVALRRVVQMQKSDGSWDCNETLLKVLGVGLNPGTQNAVLVTALAIVFLQKDGAHDAETWELIVQKAKNWLVQQDGVNVDKVISDAEKLLETATPD